jgi:outer membrane protein OmpA-like peptidoglycan-associated protein
MKNIYTIILVALCCITASAKAPKKSKGDRLSDRWEYARAAKHFEKEAAKNPSSDNYFKLGECYAKMNKYKEALAAYDKVNAAGVYSKPEFYLNYGLMLKINGKYDQAKVAFDKYNELMPGDPRGKFYSASIDIVKEDHKSDVPIVVSNVSAINSKSADFGMVQYKDGVVFTSSRKRKGSSKIYGWTGTNYLSLFYAKKGDSNLNFTDVTPFGGKKINRKFHDGSACFSQKFDTIYISRVEKDLKGEDKKTLQIERNKIVISTLKDNKWTKPTPFVLNSNSYSVANPFLTADGSRMYFVSDMPGGFGETDIYYCNRQGNTWSAPVNMGSNVNTFNREKFPSVDLAGNFYFSSDGYQGFGGLDICVALNKNGVLDKAIPMKYPFNSTADDYGISFLKDGKTGYISSNRYEGSQGDDDIFYFDITKNDFPPSVYTIGYKAKPPVEVIADVAPVETPPVVKSEKKLVVKPIVPAEKRIYFDFDKFAIRADAIAYLDKVAVFMKEYPDVTLVIGGHCDSRGTDKHNMKLSNERDNAAIAFLKSKGISSKRISATGYGAKQLVNNCTKGKVCTKEAHQLNRTVEFHFKGDKIATVD